MASTANKVFDLIKETVENCGVTLWDVRFIKEGASHYLRVFIDNENGIGIDDCSRVSHAIDPIIDEADPIDVSYYLEVCSPGLDRELTREEHFSYVVGKEVKIKLFKAIDGKKEFTGTLEEFKDGTLTLSGENEKSVFKKTDIAKATIKDEI